MTYFQIEKGLLYKKITKVFTEETKRIIIQNHKNQSSDKINILPPIRSNGDYFDFQLQIIFNKGNILQ